MVPWSKNKLLTQTINDWHVRKLIDQNTYEILGTDISSNAEKRSFSTILVLLAAVCIGFAAISFVAANWQEMPRMGKTALLLGSMCTFWVISIWCQFKKWFVYSQVAVLLACSLFGASIMLIAQMYHIQGEASDAVWLWGFGTVIAAALTRSVPALCLSILLFGTWFTFEIETIWRSQQIFYSYLTYALPSLGLAFWMRSKLALHLSLIGLGCWIVFFSATELFESYNNTFGVASITACIFLIAASFILPTLSKRLKLFMPALRFYAVTVASLLLAGWFIIQGLESNNYSQDEIRAISQFTPHAYVFGVATVAIAVWAWIKRIEHCYDVIIAAIAAIGFVTFAPYAPTTAFLAEVIILLIVLWFIRMGLRINDRGLTILGLLGFAGYMLALYGITVGTLIGTAGFYAIIGLILLGSGVILPKLLKSKDVVQ